MKQIIFIADLHLSETQPRIFEQFLQFTKNISDETEALYILGDFFEFWAGDDDHSVFNEQVKDTLLSLHAKNIQVYIMPGNRDFLLGNKFAHECNATLLNDPCLINLYDKLTLLTHGDILCSDDYGLRIFRFFTSNKFLRKLFLLLPLTFRKNLAQQVRNHCAHKQNSGKLIDVNQNEISRLLRLYNATQIIHGHTHRPKIEATRIVLGDWNEEKSSVLIYYADGSFEFS